MACQQGKNDISCAGRSGDLPSAIESVKLPAFHDSVNIAHCRMKPPSKPFFVEVRRSRSITAPASPPQRPTPPREDAPEPAGTRSKAWQHAEQFFQSRPTSPEPEPVVEIRDPVRVEPVPVATEALVEPKAERRAAARSKAKTRDAAETKTRAGRSRKVGKAPKIAEPVSATAAGIRQSRPRVPDLEEEIVTLSLAEDADSYIAEGSSNPGDEAQVPGRKPLSAKAARSAAKPAERWTCRLRHVRRNQGAGRIGQPRP